jgi:hypothetical protein
LQVGSAEPAMTSQDSSFELFGTTFCFMESAPSVRCDDALLQARLLTPLPETKSAPRWNLFGVTFCMEKTATGPACDAVWLAPTPTVAWRDYPEVRLADDMPVPLP